MEKAMNHQRDWQVLLLGGASGVGKSSLSYPLARYFDVNLTEIDDFQVILEKLTTPEEQPLLHFWRTNWDEFSSWSDEQRLEHFIQVSREVFQPALEAVIANHLETNRPVILEGDFILPELATFKMFDEQSNDGRVRGIFLCEESELQIAANYFARDREEQLFRAHSSWMTNQWLRSACERLKVPALTARPWDTILARAIAVLETPHAPYPVTKHLSQI
jgi:2-phosphoglycerate kinase